jgi:serine/threonine-protein kinase
MGQNRHAAGYDDSGRTSTGANVLKLGSIVDRYRIDSVLDEGETAVVYKVTQVWLYLPMVLKHLKEGVDPSIRHALLEEGRIQATQHHQNLVAVCDALDIEGRPALVMEFVDGPDLADWIDAHEKPTIRQALDIFRGVVVGLQEAHHRGLVHRDLKPENVLLGSAPDGTIVPKLADFGMAKRLQKATKAYTLSGTYKLIGTPEYMAPEQIRNPGLVNSRSDLFSLGAILYELVTGQLAFDGDSQSEVLQLVIGAFYEPPTSLRPDLDPALDQLIRQLLSVDPLGRPLDCSAVLSVLDGLG